MIKEYICIPMIHDIIENKVDLSNLKIGRLTSNQLLLLLAIYELETANKNQVTNISKYLGKSLSTISTSIKTLENLLLLQRVTDSNNRRNVYVTLTDLSKQETKVIYNQINQVVREVLNDFTEKEEKVIRDYKRKLKKIIFRNGDEIE